MFDRSPTTLLILGPSPDHVRRTSDHLTSSFDSAAVECASDVAETVRALKFRPVVAVVAATDGEEGYLSGDLDALSAAASESSTPVLLTNVSTPHRTLKAEQQGVLWTLREPVTSDDVLDLLETLIRGETRGLDHRLESAWDGGPPEPTRDRTRGSISLS